MSAAAAWILDVEASSEGESGANESQSSRESFEEEAIGRAISGEGGQPKLRRSSCRPPRSPSFPTTSPTMPPPTKRARMSASKQPSPFPSLEDESDDEWAAERAGQSSSQQQQRGNDGSDDDNGGVAQFMEDEGEDFDESEEEDEEVSQCSSSQGKELLLICVLLL